MQGLARLAISIALLLAGLAPAAATDLGLYGARTIVTGQGEETRRSGFAEGLEQVLVKVSGDPSVAAAARENGMTDRAGELVADFRYRDRMEGIPVHDEQGTRDRPYDLTMQFRPEAVDAVLAKLGRKPWTGPRPPIAVLVAVDHGERPYVLAADGPRGRDQREALQAAAERFGLPVALPDAAIARSLRFDEVAAEAAIAESVAKRMGGEALLAGTLAWNPEALGWTADWQLVTAAGAHRWRISGVSFDAAFRSALGGAAQVLSGSGVPE